MALKVRIEDLPTSVLDLLVAQILGIDAVMSDPYPNGTRACVTFYGREHNGRLDGRSFCPTTQWSDGGPIKESRGIHSGRMADGRFYASLPPPATAPGAYGPTELLAVMLCLIRSELGEEVDMPNLDFSHIID